MEVLDEKGNLCPDADNLVNFTVQGNGFIAGVDNGNPVSMERFKDEKRKAFYGKCLVVIQNDGKPGKADGYFRGTSASCTKDFGRGIVNCK